MKPEPMTFEPILKPRVWGGRELAQWGKHLPSGESIGESWELADLPDSIEVGRSMILSGPHAGLSLREAIERDQAMIMGNAALSDEGGFPLLIKLLDARQNLSVQVHPTQAYALKHADARVKSEAWIVLDADPGAVIYRGFKPGVTREMLLESLDRHTTADLLEAVPVEPGECHYLPSGICHALGAGIVVAEIQTPSDTTFRLYDWNRAGRTLHVEPALACIDFDGPSPQAAEPGEPIEVAGIRSTPLLSTDHFTIERQECVTEDESAALEVVTNNQPVVWLITAGQGVLDWSDGELPLLPGLTVLMPAAIEEVAATLDPGCQLLRIELPSPTRNLIA